jgi:hypothetical protein
MWSVANVAFDGNDLDVSPRLTSSLFRLTTSLSRRALREMTFPAGQGNQETAFAGAPEREAARRTNRMISAAPV